MKKHMENGITGLKRLLRDESGSPAVEFAIIAPILVLLTAGMIDVGKLGLASSTLYLAADEGARYAAVHANGSLLPKTNAEMEAYAMTHIIGIDKSKVEPDVSFVPEPAQSGGVAIMTVTYTVDLWLGNFMNINDVKIVRSSTMTVNY